MGEEINKLIVEDSSTSPNASYSEVKTDLTLIKDLVNTYNSKYQILEKRVQELEAIEKPTKAFFKTSENLFKLSIFSYIIFLIIMLLIEGFKVYMLFYNKPGVGGYFFYIFDAIFISLLLYFGKILINMKNE